MTQHNKSIHGPYCIYLYLVYFLGINSFYVSHTYVTVMVAPLWFKKRITFFIYYTFRLAKTCIKITLFWNIKEPFPKKNNYLIVQSIFLFFIVIDLA